MRVPTYAKCNKYYPVPAYFPTAASVAVTAYDLADGGSVGLSGSSMTQVGSTGRWYWSTSGFMTQPTDGKDILIVLTPNDGAEAWDELLNFGGPEDKLYDIYQLVSGTALQSAATAALNAYDPPTYSEMNSGLGVVRNDIAALNDISASEVLAQFTAFGAATESNVTAVGIVASGKPTAEEVEARCAAAITGAGLSTYAQVAAVPDIAEIQTACETGCTNSISGAGLSAGTGATPAQVREQVDASIETYAPAKPSDVQIKLSR